MKRKEERESLTGEKTQLALLVCRQLTLLSYAARWRRNNCWAGTHAAALKIKVISAVLEQNSL